MHYKYSFRLKTASLLIMTSMLYQIIYPVSAYALTGGPSQPEVQSFEPVGTSDMVDLFSGDFNYNIPLLDVGGYPVNIAYHAGVGMDQEASWVGLGWNINAGVINREMRGIPDDFQGEKIKKEFKMRPNKTYSLGVSTALTATEVFGFKLSKLGISKNYKYNLNLNLGVNYNNYKGVGMNFGLTPTFGFSDAASPKLTASLGFNYSTSGGFDVTPTLNYKSQSEAQENDDVNFLSGFKLGTNFNSRYGLQTLNYGFRVNSLEKNFSGSHSFGVKTYTPRISMPMKTHSYSLELGFGSDWTGVFPNTNFTGSFSQQTLAVTQAEKSAYGYLYEHKHPEVNKMEDHDFLLDFNRENDGSYSKNTTNLPLTNHTYDIYSVSGHGVGGSYRPFRSDIGIIGDDFARTTSTSGNGGVEFGGGNIAHWGASVNMTFHTSESGAWVGDEAKWYESRDKDYTNYSRKIFGFRDFELGKTQPDYEPYYFKKAGEMNSIDDANYQVMRGNLPIAPDATSLETQRHINFITTRKVQPTIKNDAGYLYNSFYFDINDRDNVIRKKRDKRGEVMTHLDNNERLVAGQLKYIPYAEINPALNKKPQSGYLLNARPEYHTSEVTILGEDGMRYIYGISAYNNTQIEKTFNVSGCSKNIATGQVTYTSGDNSLANGRGRDDYYSSVETPGYAHSYLLTGIVSNDYVDLTGNGISDDDYGTSVKVNYSKVHDEYPWRTPYNSNSASLADGLRSTNTDDKGSYVYGTKEIWYMSSIESKTHIAYFRISTREDGLGVNGENGGANTSARLYKLDKIELYSKQDIYLNGTSAKPVKVVNFQYDYSLCPNVENNSGNTGVTGNTNKGKLTLKKIWFTYESSYRGRMAPYTFEYAGTGSQPGINPDYNLKGSDAWGNYKEMLGSNDQFTGNLSNSDYPYTDNDKGVSDENAFAWCLTEIKLPSGGKIKVTYEADDYAYVENKRAMEMVKIKGFGRSEDHNNRGNRLFYPTGVQRHMDIVFFELAEAYSGSNPSDYIRKHYLEGIKYLQFTVLTKIKDDNQEYVKGYCEIDWEKGCGISGGQGWVAIKTVHINDKDDGDARHRISPIAKTIWNYAKLNTPNLIYPEPDQETQGLHKQIVSLFNVMGTDFYRNIRGINKSLEDQKFGAWISTDKSWLRLNSPFKKRLGGGHRVKKIELSDNWQEMAYPEQEDASFSYGQEYEYSVKEKQNNGEIWEISSGVASNLPALGGDESPLTQPIFTETKNILVPDEEAYDDRPIGESFFPSPNVGYKRVVVRALQHEDVKRTANGYSVNEFYTAYDFPTIVRQTQIYRQNFEPDPFFSMFQTKHETRVTASQGYAIELNDMHGKPKAQYAYAEGATEPMSWTKSLYQTDTTQNPYSLNNKVLTITPDKTIKEKEIGVEYDFIMDNRQQSSQTYDAGVAFNTEAMALLIFPIIVPSILPSYSKEDVQFKSSVGTKVIKKYGVLKETIAFQEGSTIKTSNLLYDDQTGDVLLTSVQNEFNDNVYSLTYPAHWAYDGMGQAYKNIGFTMSDVEIKNDDIKLPASLVTASFLTPGDECLVTYPNGEQIMSWVYLGNGNKLNLIDQNGVPLTTGKEITIKVLRSGRRNLHNSPIASFTMLSNPLVKSGSNYTLTLSNIINTEAVEYKEDWKTHLDLLPTYQCDTSYSRMYSLFTNFLRRIPSNDTLSTVYYADYSSGNNFYIHDTIFNYNIATRRDTGTGLFYQLKEYYDFGDSIFVRYRYLDSSNQWVFYPYQFVEIVGVANYIPRPKLPNENYQFGKYWTVAGYGSGSLIHTMGGSAEEFNDSITKLFTRLCNPDSAFPCELSSELQYFTIGSGNNNNSLSGTVGGCNECTCSFNLLLNKSNRFKKILVIDNFNPVSNQQMTARMIVERAGGQHDTLSAVIKSTCLEFAKCDYSCNNNLLEEKVVNPYRANLSGNWRAFKTYKYLGERTYQSGSPNTRTDGVYTTFNSFWNYNATTKRYEPNTSEAKWVNASEITEYTPFGNEVENKDALGNYSASLFGYKNTLTVAVASNCKYTQLGFDGFEDYNSRFSSNLECDVNHFNFVHTLSGAEGIHLDNTYQHTGNFSLKVPSGDAAELSRAMVLTPVSTIISDESDIRVAKISDDLGVFRPGEGKYVLGAWIRSEEKIGDTTYANGLMQIEITDASNAVTTINCSVKGKIIEGWQRVEQVFEIPAGTKSIKIKLNGGAESDTWFDDIRIHTYDGNMKSYVYDYRLLKLMAEMDENNYATLYEYNQEGALVRVKKETERGIVTIKETRNHTKGVNTNE